MVPEGSTTHNEKYSHNNSNQHKKANAWGYVLKCHCCIPSPGRVADPFLFCFLLTNVYDWMIPLRYVNSEEVPWLFRVADPFGF